MPSHIIYRGDHLQYSFLVISHDEDLSSNLTMKQWCQNTFETMFDTMIMCSRRRPRSFFIVSQYDYTYIFSTLLELWCPGVFSYTTRQGLKCSSSWTLDVVMVSSGMPVNPLKFFSRTSLSAEPDELWLHKKNYDDGAAWEFSSYV